MAEEKNCKLCFHYCVCYAVGNMTERAETCAKHAPTADVVPRSEVEKIFEEIEKIRSKEIHRCEVLREKETDPSERKYWEGGGNSLRQLSFWIAELKKKYTEEQK